jgi:hypothetical protein
MQESISLNFANNHKKCSAELKKIYFSLLRQTNYQFVIAGASL